MSKKRLNNEGSISFNVAKGLSVTTITHEGKRLFRYGRTKKAVVDKLHALQSKKDNGVQLVDSKMFLKGYLNAWLELIKPTIRPKSYEGYESIVRVHIIPRLGHVRLNKLTTEHINKAWSSCLKKVIHLA